MRKYYDFSNAKRGPVVREDTRGKTRITIRLDDAVLAWFKQQCDEAGGRGGSYQTMINAALREHIQRQSLEATLRRVVREEFQRLNK